MGEDADDARRLPSAVGSTELAGCGSRSKHRPNRDERPARLPARPALNPDVSLPDSDDEAPTPAQRHAFAITIFPDESAQRKKQRDVTLSGLRDLIGETTAPTRDRLPWLKLARFGKDRTDKNCLRNNANVLRVTGVEMDYDGGVMSFDEAVRVAGEANLCALIYTTPSHIDAKPKWRVLTPTSGELEPEERAALAARVNGLYGGVFDPASFTLSQAFVFGSLNGNPAHRAVVVEGDLIDLRGDLDAIAVGKDGKQEVDPFTSYADEQALKKPIVVGQRLADMRYQGEGESGIHQTQLSVTASLMCAGRGVEDAVEYIIEATRRAAPVDEVWDWGKEEKAVRGMCETWLKKHPQDKHDDGPTASAPRGQGKKTGEFASWDGREPDSYDWLWRHWLAKGELHLIAGAIGAGKTTITLSLAATVTSGGEWPDGSNASGGGSSSGPARNSVEKALMPRFMAMSGDRSRIGGISVVENGKKRSFDPAVDIDVLRGVLEDQRRRGEPVSLIVIDPFIVVAKTDSHKNAETRRDMQPLVDLAREFDAAVIGVTHYTKGTQRQAVNERVTGSLAFGAQARAIFAAVVRDDEAEPGTTKRSFIRTKSNFGPSGGGFAYDVEATQIVPANKMIECTAIRWGDPIDGSAQRLVDEAENGGKKESAVADAVGFLAVALADGPRPKTEVEEEAAANLITPITLRRARQQIGVVVKKESGVEHGRWLWSLPPSVTVKRRSGPLPPERSLRGRRREQSDAGRVPLVPRRSKCSRGQPTASCPRGRVRRSPSTRTAPDRRCRHTVSPLSRAASTAL